jgi:HprK-related kinase A
MKYKMNLNLRLNRGGAFINTGPFKFLIQSDISSIAVNISNLYDDFSWSSIEDRPCFGDFHVSISLQTGVRRWVYKQVQFFLDGQVVFNPFPIHHATAMLEWGMNWCISTQIHTYLIIHSAVIEKNGFAAVLPAPPGSGKSTLCASLVQEGWRLLSDELTLINLHTAEAVPVPRPIGLKNQSIDIIQQRYPEAVFGILSSDTLKGSVCHLKPPKASVERQFEECPIGWIIFPKYEAGSATELTPKSKGQAFMEIANNAFNYSVLGEEGFDILKKVVDRADCYSFKYSNLDEAIAVFEQLEAPREV